MKARLIVTATLLLCATIAVAQLPNITFNGDLNATKMPQRIPDGYHDLNWSGFFYLVGYGMGLQQGTESNVAVTGLCGTHCPATLGTTRASQAFNLYGAQIAGGWGNNTLTVMPMRNGAAIGVFVFQLTTTPIMIDFTQYWTGPVDSVVFTPSSGAVVFNCLSTDTN